MDKPKHVTVYCSMSARLDPVYYEAGAEVGAGLARAGIRLVYGGMNRGLMGTVANSALEAGGHVTGVYPNIGELEQYRHDGLSELVIVDEMQARKREMFDRADAFIVLPGGYGTLDEAFEVLTLNKIGVFRKTVYFLNTCGYWEPMARMLEGVIDARTMDPHHREFYRFADNAAELLALLAEDENLFAP